MHKGEERLLVYPFGRKILPFCGIQNGKRRISAAVAPRGLGINELDVGTLDERRPLGIVAHSDFCSCVADCDTVLFTDELYDEENKQEIERNIQAAIERDKSIILSVALEAQKKAEIKRACETKGLEYTDLTQRTVSDGPNIENRPHMYTPTASVIFVGELMGSCNGTDVVIGLLNHFKQEGYRASAIFTQREARVFGFHAQDECFVEEYPCHKQIDFLNAKIQQIDETEAPDVIIVQIPGGMLKMNSSATNEHGIYAYMWSQAVTPDCFVLCVPYQMLDSDRAKELNTLMYYRFGFHIDAVHMSNITLDAAELATYFITKWFFTSSSKVMTYLEANRIMDEFPIYYALDDKQMAELCRHIEQKLLDMGNSSTI